MSSFKKYQYLTQDIRFWLLLVFIFQLFFITTPPLEPIHSWRQTLTNMIARNMIQEGGSLLYPKMDYGGHLTGIMATELPLLQYIISVFYHLFGFNHWIGRLINLVVSLLGVFYFYKTSYFWLKNKKISFYSAVFLLFSIWFSFSRKIMPDTFSVSLAIFAIHWLTRFFQTNKLLFLVLYILMANIAIMAKIPAALLFSWLPLLLFSKIITKHQKMWLVFGGTLSLIGPLFWYGYWVPYLKLHFEFPLFFPKNITEGALEIWINRWDLIVRIGHNGFNSIIASVVSFIGLFLVIKKYKRNAFFPFLIIASISVFYIIKTGEVFATHNYYMVPLVPFMAITAAFALDYVNRQNAKWAKIILILFVLESISFQWHDFFVRSSKKYMTQLELESNSILNRDEKIITNGKDDPQLMYYLNKKGWSLKDEHLTPDYIKTILKYHPSWLIIDKNQSNSDELIKIWVNENLSTLETDNLIAFDLRPLW